MCVWSHVYANLQLNASGLCYQSACIVPLVVFFSFPVFLARGCLCREQREEEGSFVSKHVSAVCVINVAGTVGAHSVSRCATTY